MNFCNHRSSGAGAGASGYTGVGASGYTGAGASGYTGAGASGYTGADASAGASGTGRVRTRTGGIGGYSELGYGSASGAGGYSESGGSSVQVTKKKRAGQNVPETSSKGNIACKITAFVTVVLILNLPGFFQFSFKYNNIRYHFPCSTDLIMKN